MDSRRLTALVAALAAALLVAFFLVPALVDREAAEPNPPESSRRPESGATPPAPPPRAASAPTPAPRESSSPPSAPEPETARAKGRARGRVVDPAGEPVAAAIVYRIAAHEDSVDGERADEMPTTAASGRFSFEVATDVVADVGVSKAGYAPVLLRDVALSGSSETDLGDIVLGAGADVTGRVADPSGAPVARVPVRALPLSEKGEAVEWSARTKGGMISLPGRALLSMRPAEGLTESDGTYAIRGLAAGASYRVEPAVDGAASAAVTIVAPAAGVDFVLAETGVIVVTTLDAATGEPLGGARVAVSGPMNSGRHFPDWLKEPARFENGIVRGEYVVTSEVRGYAQASERVLLEDTSAPLEVTLRLERTGDAALGAIRVVARDDGGSPIPQMCLAVRLGGRVFEANPGRGTDNKNGIREIANLEPGGYEVFVTSQSRDYGAVEREAEIVAGETTSLEVTLPRAGRLAVDVRDESGGAVRGYTLDVLGATGERIDAEISVKSGVFSTMGYEPGNAIEYPGRVRIARLPAGDVTLVFGGAGFAGERVAASVKAGEETVTSVTLRRSE